MNVYTEQLHYRTWASQILRLILSWNLNKIDRENRNVIWIRPYICCRYHFQVDVPQTKSFANLKRLLSLSISLDSLME